MSTLTAVVTGASSGIGEDTVKRLISLDWNVIMIARSVDKMEKIAKSCIEDDEQRNQRIKIIGFDLSKAESLENELIPSIKQCAHKLNNNGCIDLLVNNAGGGTLNGNPNPKRCSLDAWNFTMNLNLTAPFLLMKCLREELIKSSYPASIVNIGSITAYYPDMLQIPYDVAKRGLQMLNTAYAVYYAKYKIRVNNIEPGFIETPIHRRSETETEREYLIRIKGVEAITPIGRVGKSKDIVDAIMFLSDPNKSSFITGQDIIIDGGLSLPLVHKVRSKM